MTSHLVVVALGTPHARGAERALVILASASPRNRP